MKQVAIKELVTSVPRLGPSRDNARFTYVDLSSVDASSKSVISPTELALSEAPSRARQNLETNDVLVSTVRPNLNGVASVPASLDNAIGSTGFSVLRPRPDLLDHRYLFHWVRTARFVELMTRLATGASYPAVTDAIIKSSTLPLPPLPEQRRIAAILDEADALRTAHNAAIARIDELKVGAFHQRFIHRRVALHKVAGVLLDAPNSIRTGPFGSDLLHSEFVDEGIPVLGIDNVVQNAFAWAKPRFITGEKYESLRRYTVRPGDVLITIMGTVGRCAVVPEDVGTAINTKHLCCISLDRSKCLPEYLHGYFLNHPTAREYLRKTSKGAVMDGLNMGIIKNLPLLLPPIDEQREYVATLTAIDSLGRQLRTRDLDSLFATLQHRAFRGEL